MSEGWLVGQVTAAAAEEGEVVVGGKGIQRLSDGLWVAKEDG